MKRAAILCIALVACSTPYLDAGETPEAGADAASGGTDAGMDGAAPSDAGDSSDSATGPEKLVFVTKGLLKIVANFVTVADNLCNTEGTAARPSATFVAWLSTPTANAIDGLPKDGTWKLANRTDVVFPDRASVTSGALGHRIDEHADGSSVIPATQAVWTNTKGNGTVKTLDPSRSCQNFSSANTGLFGTAGRPAEAVSSQWTDDRDLSCDQPAAIICFEQ